MLPACNGLLSKFQSGAWCICLVLQCRAELLKDSHRRSFNAAVKMLMFWLRASSCCRRLRARRAIQRWLNWFRAREALNNSRERARPLIWFVVRAIEDLLSAWWECVRYKVARRYAYVYTRSADEQLRNLSSDKTSAQKTRSSSRTEREKGRRSTLGAFSARMMNWTANCPLHCWAINTRRLERAQKKICKHVIYSATFISVVFAEEPVNCVEYDEPKFVLDKLMPARS
jgi:hypothetical protein